MTCYTLLRNVDYEGSSLLGVFASIDDALELLETLDGYLMEEFAPTQDDMVVQEDEWYLDQVQNSIAAWEINGPSDLSFTICAIELGA